MLKNNVDFGTLLIGVEGTKTPAGVRGRGDPAGAKSAEEAPRHAREPLVPGTEINRLV
ncbi:multidrug transporter [Neobacillus sp. KR4-4]|uniref:multidrug transporter n=1 Tax=Neobacillus sp. KR4-4 TaxID=3344872 RepID=UPI0035CC102C